MNREEVRQYVEAHPDSRFHIKLHNSLGVMKEVEPFTDRITDPRNGEVVTIYRERIKENILNDVIVSVIEDGIGPNALSIYLQKPHHQLTSMNYNWVRYIDIESIEAVKS